ncbi:inositol monophosphatase [Meredithblackwellia eburnea MCA 4105]
MVDTLDLDEIYKFAIDIAKQGGKIIREASSKRSASAGASSADSSKKNRVDLVTETDQAVEKFVLETIAAKYPTHTFIGEESFAAGKKAEFTSNPTWICDPIDGTTNFVHSFDHVAISIGFTVNKKPVIGVIYNPFLDKLYSAQAGKGAFLNQSIRLPLSHPDPPPLQNLGNALVAVEYGSDRSKTVMDKKMRTFTRLASDGKEVEGGVMVHSLRSIGSAALNYSYVAAGQLDLYWEIGCWSWDVCAGTIIALESGAQVYGRSGKKWEDDDLMDHYYFVVRAIGDTETEKGSDAQDRIAKQFFSVAEEWDV